VTAAMASPAIDAFVADPDSAFADLRNGDEAVLLRLETASASAGLSPSTLRSLFPVLLSHLDTLSPAHASRILSCLVPSSPLDGDSVLGFVHLVVWRSLHPSKRKAAKERAIASGVINWANCKEMRNKN
jgi:hypothetical protein